MKKAKAMMDALMGPSRDVAAKDKRNDEFNDANCCKNYLVGCCPDGLLGKKLDAIRHSPEVYKICQGSVYQESMLSPTGCSKLHSKGLKTQLNDHPEAAKYKVKYERDLQKMLVKVMEEAEGRAERERKKRENPISEKARNENEHCWFKSCDVCCVTYKLMKNRLGADERKNLGQTVVNGEIKMPGDWVCPNCKDIQFARNPVCRNCDATRPKEALMELEGDVEDLHAETELHQAYVNLRKKLADLNEKLKDAPGEEEEKPPVKDAESKGKDTEKGRERSRSKNAREGRERSPSRGGGRSSRGGDYRNDDRDGRRDRSGGYGGRDNRDRRRSESRDRGRGRNSRSDSRPRGRSRSARGSQANRRDQGYGRRSNSRRRD